MTEEKDTTPSTVLDRALNYAWKIATVVMCIWVVVGLPTLKELDPYFQLSRLQTTLAWAIPSLLAAFGLAWWSRHRWLNTINASPLARFRRGAPAAEELGQTLLSLRSDMLKRVEDGAATVEREPRGSEESVGISAFKAKTLDLSSQSVSVLEYLLRLYLSRPGMVIREAMSAPEFPASPLASLTGARREATLKQLVHRGFLQEYGWEGETFEARLAECLSDRSVAEVLFKWLQQLMAEGRTGFH